MRHHRVLTSWIAIVGTLCAMSAWGHAADTKGFSLVDGESPDSLDVVCDGQIVGRYMYAHDTSTPALRHDTYKPYLHVFDAQGKAPITKGPGGLFTHHRGIFIGWNKIGCNGKNFDRWHMSGGEQVHQAFSARQADTDHATFTSVVHWNDTAGKPLIEEARSMTFRRAPAPAYALIDFESTLKATAGDVTLDGDPEHAGIQFRPADEVDKAKTTYVYAGPEISPHKATDLAWIGETFWLDGQSYSVVQMNHPDNPTGTRISAYRNYGRFGMFPTATIKAGETRTFRYRFLVAAGEMPAAEMIQAACNAFTGKSDEAPAVTIKRAE
jgi:hypothetical protein